MSNVPTTSPYSTLRNNYSMIISPTVVQEVRNHVDGTESHNKCFETLMCLCRCGANLVALPSPEPHWKVKPPLQSKTLCRDSSLTIAGPSLDQGGSGSYNSHWEYELFQGDLMTPTKPADGSPQRFSRLTLALLQDTGWCALEGPMGNGIVFHALVAILNSSSPAHHSCCRYIGIWAAASYLNWGRNAGCTFALSTSAAYKNSNPSEYERDGHLLSR